MTELLAWIQVATFVVIFCTLLVYWGQLKALQLQVTAARDSSRTQNLLALIDYIQRPEHREARRVLHSLDKKPYGDWTVEERKCAEMAGSAWDAVGLILRNTTTPQAKELVLSHWRHSIYSCHRLTSELLKALREDREPNFWADFDWLSVEACVGYIVIDGKMRPKA